MNKVLSIIFLLVICISLLCSCAPEPPPPLIVSRKFMPINEIKTYNDKEYLSPYQLRKDDGMKTYTFNNDVDATITTQSFKEHDNGSFVIDFTRVQHTYNGTVFYDDFDNFRKANIFIDDFINIDFNRDYSNVFINYQVFFVKDYQTYTFGIPYIKYNIYDVTINFIRLDSETEVTFVRANFLQYENLEYDSLSNFVTTT